MSEDDDWEKEPVRCIFCNEIVYDLRGQDPNYPVCARCSGKLKRDGDLRSVAKWLSLVAAIIVLILKLTHSIGFF